jgi:hypothetical protein
MQGLNGVILVRTRAKRTQQLQVQAVFPSHNIYRPFYFVFV